jgi:hypothetical protein
MNQLFNGGSRVHRGLRPMPTFELTGALAPGLLWPQGLTEMAPTRRGASGDPHHKLQQQQGDEDRADDDGPKRRRVGAR